MAAGEVDNTDSSVGPPGLPPRLALKAGPPSSLPIVSTRSLSSLSVCLSVLSLPPDDSLAPSLFLSQLFAKYRSTSLPDGQRISLLRRNGPLMDFFYLGTPNGLPVCWYDAQEDPRDHGRRDATPDLILIGIAPWKSYPWKQTECSFWSSTHVSQKHSILGF